MRRISLPSPGGYSYPQIPRKAQSRKNRNKSKKGNEKKNSLSMASRFGATSICVRGRARVVCSPPQPPLGLHFFIRCKVPSSCILHKRELFVSLPTPKLGSPTLVIGVTLRCFKARLVPVPIPSSSIRPFPDVRVCGPEQRNYLRLRFLLVEQRSVVQVFLWAVECQARSQRI